ncbi:hypothetical protein C5P26_27085, partial [Escherichia coli]
QQVKADRNARCITDQMQLPTPIVFAFAGTIAPIGVALNFAAALRPYPLAHRNRQGVNDEDVPGHHQLTQQAHEEQQDLLQRVQAPVEARHAQFGQIARLLQQAQRPF